MGSDRGRDEAQMVGMSEEGRQRGCEQAEGELEVFT